MSNSTLAYCCLNCGENPNCCGVCGECPECCKDCGNLAGICNSHAYISRDNKLYLKWAFSWRYSLLQKSYPCYDYCTNETFSSSVSYGSCYSDNRNNGVYVYSAGGPLCCECDCPDNKGLYYGTVQNFEGGTTSVSGCTTEDPDGVGCSNVCVERTSYDIGPMSCPTVNDNEILCNPSCTGGCCEPCSDPCDPYCSECLANHPDEERINRIHKTSSLIWYAPVSLYNSSGEKIEDIWSILDYPNSYDQCHPIREVYAPPCYFFASF